MNSLHLLPTNAVLGAPHQMWIKTRFDLSVSPRSLFETELYKYIDDLLELGHKIDVAIDTNETLMLWTW